MGWSHQGNTRQKYQHYYTDDAFDAMLITMDGLMLPSQDAKSRSKNLLKPKMCPNCDESNKPESKFCVKCKFVLSFEAFNEGIEEKEKAAKEAELQKKQMQQMAQEFEKMKVDLSKVSELARMYAFRIGEDTLTIQKQQARLGEIPPLRPIDTETTPTDGMPPELLKLMYTPWSEIEESEKKKKIVKTLLGQTKS
jgi:hypothetical protein